MKPRHLIPLVLIAVAVSLHAQADSALENQMKILARGNRQLSQQVGDSARQQSTIELIESLKKAALDAKSLDPRKTSEIPEAKRSQFLADYRTEVDELRDSFDKIEEAVKAGQYDKAKSLLATVNSIKKEGHGKFKTD
jgi:soluble cytochrome b562